MKQARLSCMHVIYYKSNDSSLFFSLSCQVLDAVESLSFIFVDVKIYVAIDIKIPS